MLGRHRKQAAGLVVGNRVIQEHRHLLRGHLAVRIAEGHSGEAEVAVLVAGIEHAAVGARALLISDGYALVGHLGLAGRENKSIGTEHAGRKDAGCIERDTGRAGVEYERYRDR